MGKKNRIKRKSDGTLICKVLNALKQAEIQAFDETLKKYPVELASVFEEFAYQLKEAFEKQF